MRVLHSVLAVALAVSAANADALLDKVKGASLVPIPQDEKAVMEIINNPKDPITKEKVELGKMLYFDPRLSKSSLISCNTCHNLALGGVDGVSAAIGHKWTANPHNLNSPTVYNSVLNKVQFWDGRSPHLENQAQGPMQAGPEMASPKELVEKRVTSIPAYVELFKKAYPKQKITFEKIAGVIGVFERTLVTPSPYDAFLNGNTNALTKEQKAGLNLFIDKGCATCHNGMAVGGNMMPFQVVKKYKFANVGDFKGDKNGMVKTPTLRNIALTAPYFHNGQIWNLADAVKEMGSVQLGISISDKDAKSIVEFLNSLTGEMPKIEYPILPASTENTPKPEAN